MTNLINKNDTDDVQVHIDNAYKILDLHLPTAYVDTVLKKLPKDQYSKSVIRNVRAKLNIKLEVLNALVEVALENKNQIEILKKQIS